MDSNDVQPENVELNIYSALPLNMAPKLPSTVFMFLLPLKLIAAVDDVAYPVASPYILIVCVPAVLYAADVYVVSVVLFVRSIFCTPRPSSKST